MNKKVSTLLTVGLMLGGSLLSSSAFAQRCALVGDKVDGTTVTFESGSTYFIMTTTGEVALGMQDLDMVNQTTLLEGAWVNDIPDDMEEADNYMWKVTESPKDVTNPNGSKVYTLTNLGTGKQLLVNKTGLDYLKDYSDTSVAADPSFFTFSGCNPYTPASILYALNDPYRALIINESTGEVTLGSGGSAIAFYEVEDQDINAGNLNKLYNSFGFNFEIKDGVENIFDQEGVRVKAIEVDSDLKFNENGTIDSNGEYAFPAGTYFVTETPEAVTPTSNPDLLNYLLKCTFIAVSSSSNVSQDANKQKAGEGFVFTTVKGEDLVTYNVTSSSAQASKLPKNSEISVHNACFDVALNSSSKYSLTLPQFRYQATSGAETQTIKTNIQINTSSDKYGATEYLCTTAPSSTKNYIFTFTEGSAVNPVTTLLKADGQAAIYNIQFVSGENDDKDELNKYLFAPAYTPAFFAKGEVLTDTNMPEFQFVITNVNGNNVTFTNRANNNAKFTVQLFAEADGSYIMACDDNTAFTALNVKENGDIEKLTAELINGKVVKLSTPASTDKFNGTWNVEDGTEVTISFARDEDPTSNRLYPVVGDNGYFDAPTDEAYEGAHWQLIKSDKPSYLTRMFAYRVGEGDDATVSFKNATDTTAYYTYKFQLVEDGDVVDDKYLRINSSDLDILATTETAATNFVIKNNVDGSTSIINSYTGTNHIAFKYYTDVTNSLDKYLNNNSATPELRSLADANLFEAPKAAYIKTYLTSDAPEISWMKEGHAMIQSELGNFISPNENNDAIVVANDEEVYYLNQTDKDAVIPSYFITRGTSEGSTAESSRLYLFNPKDSVDYYVGAGKYDKKYQWEEETTKVIFKAAQLNASADTLTTNIKGKATKVATKADNKGTEGGLKRFKFQIIETEDGNYYIRQTGSGNVGNYLSSFNEKLTWAERAKAMKFTVKEAAAPTANEAISATDVKVVALDGAVNVKNAAGKNVVVSTILGQIVANEVLTSDNATISVPAGIAIVSVDGEEAVKVSVK